jgi:hypothetical protein
VSGKYINTKQIQLYMDERDAGSRQITAAVKAGISQRSGRRIESGRHQPKAGEPRDWRTRVDPLAEVWQRELEPLLQRNSRIEAMTLFEYLQEHYPGSYQNVLRTLQRRVADWKALHGSPPPVMFELRHTPGEMGFSDFTELKEVTITIQGIPFEHLLYHYRLGYSGWQYVQIIRGGESFIGLSQGLQNALWACGGVPKVHRSDSLSAAFFNSGGKHKLTQRYEALCRHYQMRPTRNNTGVAHENGAIESSHGYFKRRLTQQLYLRNSFDFDSVAAYAQFIETLIAKLNGKCSEKFAIEKEHLHNLPNYRTADYEVLSVKVSCRSTVDVRSVLYTVPERLIGRSLTVHLYHDQWVGYLGQQKVVEIARLSAPASHQGRRPRVVNYRHLIEGLRKKPRVLLYCSWDEELLPNDEYRQLWQQMLTTFERDSAARVMVEALYIAATQDKEASVGRYLQSALSQQTLTLVGLQRHFQLLQAPQAPDISVQQHPLSNYDLLLTYDSSTCKSLRESDPASAPTQAQPYAQPLAALGTTGDPGALELRSIPFGTLGIRNSPTLPGAHPESVERIPIAPQQSPQQLRVYPLPDSQPGSCDAVGTGYELDQSGQQRLDFWSIGCGKNPLVQQCGTGGFGIGQAGQVFQCDFAGATAPTSQAQLNPTDAAQQARSL